MCVFYWSWHSWHSTFSNYSNSGRLLLSREGCAHTHMFSSLRVLYQDVTAEVEFLRFTLGGISFPGSSFPSLSPRVRVWKALQQQEQVKAFTSGISGSLSTHSVLQSEVGCAKIAHWLRRAGQRSWCEYLLVAMESAEPPILLMQVVVPFAAVPLCISSMTQ